MSPSAGDAGASGRAESRVADLEAQLAAEQEKVRALASSLAEGLVVLDTTLRVDTVNAEALRILDVSAEAVLGRHIDDVASTWRLRDRGPYATSKMRHHLLRGLPYRNDDAFAVGDDHQILGISLVMSPVEVAGVRQGAVISLRDVTDIKATATVLRESEERFRAMFSMAPAGILRLDTAGVVVEANRALHRILGRDTATLAGARLDELVHAADLDAVTARLEAVVADVTGGPPGEWRFVRSDGSTVWTSTSFALVRGRSRAADFVIGVVEDLTDRRLLEVRLRHAQKLEAVGRLAGGIAHELNTPIQFVSDNVRFLGEAYATVAGVVDGYREAWPGSRPAALDAMERDADLDFLGEEVPNALEETLAGLGRIASIVESMKRFGRPERSERAPTDVNRAVESTVAVAATAIREVGDLETELGDVPPVPCSVGDLNQAVLHLLTNAAEAVGAVAAATGRRGRVTVRTWAETDTAVIAVTDTGAGVPEDVRDRIFEPFFTTRRVGEGVGQGLALARAVVVDQHGGTLTFDSEVGEGTTFYVRLPLSAHAP